MREGKEQRIIIQREEKIDINKNKKEASQELSQILLKKIFVNILKAIAIFVYCIALNIAFSKLQQNNFIDYTKIVSILFLLIGLFEFERAYKKDSGMVAVNSVELVFLSFHLLSMVHVCTLLKYEIKSYIVFSSYAFAIYYVLKSIILYTRDRKQYLKSLSDVSDIVKKEEPTKREASRTKSQVHKNKTSELEIMQKAKRESVSRRTTTRKKVESIQNYEIGETNEIKTKSSTKKTATRRKSVPPIIDEEIESQPKVVKTRRTKSDVGKTTTTTTRKRTTQPKTESTRTRTKKIQDNEEVSDVKENSVKKPKTRSKSKDAKSEKTRTSATTKKDKTEKDEKKTTTTRTRTKTSKTNGETIKKKTKKEVELNG